MRVLEKFESLLQDETKLSKEAVFQSFLQEHPLLLAHAHLGVVPKRQIGCGKEFEIDFVIRSGDEYTVVEIEKPSLKLFTQSGDFTKEFSHAERQVLDFLQWIDENLPTARTVMPGIRNPGDWLSSA